MKRKAVPFFLLPIMALAVVAFAFLHPASSSHAAMRLHLMATNQYLHSSKKTGNLIYHGGPIMPGTMQAYAIFWEPTGSFVSPNYNSLITRYFGDVGSSSLYHNNTQYNDQNGNIPSGAAFGGSWVDTALYPSSTLTDQQIQNEVTHAMTVNGWTADITHAFFVFTAKNETICNGSQCSFTTFCAYHSFFGTNTIYAAMPYTGTNLAACGVHSSPNGDRDADSTINVTSHEQMEAATDPFGNAWFDASANEIGDKCLWKFSPTINHGDVILNNNTYMVQKEWDNTKNTCVLSGP